jgi:hypothetical protein
MTTAVKEDEPANPPHISLLRSGAEMAGPDRDTDALEELRGSGGDRDSGRATEIGTPKCDEAAGGRSVLRWVRHLGESGREACRGHAEAQKSLDEAALALVTSEDPCDAARLAAPGGARPS